MSEHTMGVEQNQYQNPPEKHQPDPYFQDLVKKLEQIRADDTMWGAEKNSVHSLLNQFARLLDDREKHAPVIEPNYPPSHHELVGLFREHLAKAPPIALSPEDIAYLERVFRHHPPLGDQVGRYETLRAAARAFAITILTHCPASPERETALVSLQTASFHANASIARNE